MSLRHIFLFGLSLWVMTASNSSSLHAQGVTQDKSIYLIIRGDDIGSELEILRAQRLMQSFKRPPR